MTRSILLLIAMHAVASADASFLVHSTDGGLAVSSNPCGQSTRDYLDKIIADTPRLDLGKNNALTMTRTGYAPAPAATTFAGDPVIGLWTFAGGTSWMVSIRPVPDQRPVVEIQISRRVDERVCYEKWQGQGTVSK